MVFDEAMLMFPWSNFKLGLKDEIKEWISIEKQEVKIKGIN